MCAETKTPANAGVFSLMQNERNERHWILTFVRMTAKAR